MQIEWPALMRAGMVGLRLSPDVFWALTPAELMMLLGHGALDAPMTRARLGDLLRAYPDGGKPDERS